MGSDSPLPKQRLAQRIQKQAVAEGRLARLSSTARGSAALGAWFLGPKAENAPLLEELVHQAVDWHAKARQKFQPDDPVWLTEARKESPAYVESVEHLKRQFAALLGELEGSVPFYSYRYQGHMLWDVTLPSVAAYFAAMLFNQNNVAAEASPVTTWLEMIVGDELCRMLGYFVPPRDEHTGQYQPTDAMTAWGHITCDGSVANSEALWAARNAKYYALGLAAALTRVEELKPARGLTVMLPTGERRVLIELDSWQLLNLQVDEVLDLRRRLKEEYPLKGNVDLDALLLPYTVQEAGLLAFHRDFAPDAQDPVVVCPATAHYSWPKAAALLGLGRGSTLQVQVDLDARLDLKALRLALDSCLRQRRPVLMLVVVLGTTEESAVDPLQGVLALRDEYRQLGMDFWIHVDAAWGGYFASMTRPTPEVTSGSPLGEPDERSEAMVADHAHQVFYGPELVLSKYVLEQYAALGRSDSITVDPHKAGYIPYPAGGLCYRNSAMRHLVAFTAPIVYHGGVDPTVGVFGIEGSKPGAAAAAVYLSHRVIPTDQSGYGRILGRCLWNSKRLYCELITMVRPDDPFKIVLFQRLPSERNAKATPKDVEQELHKIRSLVVGRTNEELLHMLEADAALKEWFTSLGSDQIIVSYAFNLVRDGVPNQDPCLVNRFNRKIFERLSLGSRAPGPPETPLFVTASSFDPAVYGEDFVSFFQRRLGVEDGNRHPVEFLLSTTMNPWLTDTADGNFIPRIIDALRETILSVIASEAQFSTERC